MTATVSITLGSNPSDIQGREKELAGRHAATYVEDGMVVGLGTGSTAAYATKALAKRMHSEGLRFRGVCTSSATESLARSLGITVVEFETVPHCDIYIDGADEIDGDFTMIKGGGGALLREKLIATYSQRRIIVANKSKRVVRLGQAFPLPVEVVRFGAEKVLAPIEKVTATKASFRQKDGQRYTTDEGHHIIDCAPGILSNPAELETELLGIPGVVTTGFFFGLCQLLIVGNGEEVQTFTPTTSKGAASFA